MHRRADAGGLHMDSFPHLRWAGAVALAALITGHAQIAAAPSRCERVLSALGAKLADATCTESPDLTTANPATTPANNSIPTLPPFAFTPQTDRDTIAPEPPHRTPITAPLPSVQINCRMAAAPQALARLLLPMPVIAHARI